MPSYSQYKRFLSVLDTEQEEGYWFTTKTGMHVHVLEGESKEQATQRTIEEKQKSSGKGQKSPENKAKKPEGSSSQEKPKAESGKKWKYPWVDFSKEGAEKKFIAETYPKVKKILSKAYFEEPEITNDLKSIKGIKFHGLDYRRKSKDSAVGKINRERGEEGNEYKQNWSDRKIMSKMYDLVRYTQVVDADKFVEQAQKTIDTLKSKGYKVVQLKNFWLPEVNNNGKNPYRGINMKWKSPKGQNFEFQFNTDNNIRVKDDMHKIYEKVRNMGEGEEKTALNNKSLELTKKFDNPKGIEKLHK